MSFQLPKMGFVFWPVGTGDSTTIAINEDVIMQVDLHHLEKSEDEDEPHLPIVDELVRLLPKKDKKPYLSVFVLTHPDKDHIQGFEKLLEEVKIGEIWHTPRIFREYKKDLCDDAKKFREEVNRRRKITIDKKGDVEAGDRVRVIGHDDIFEDDKYKDFPEKWRSYPASIITDIDGENFDDLFETFIHAPFKDDSAAEKNDTSLALQITLKCGDQSARALLLGDRCYPTIKKIFDKTKEKKRETYLKWDILLAPHHCSKKVMFWQDEGEEKEKFKPDMMGDFEEFAEPSAYIVSSSESDFSDKDGKNPPHLKARKKYEQIIDVGHFLCTHEHPNTKNPVPIKFELNDEGFIYTESKSEDTENSADLTAAIGAARGGATPPEDKVGFGKL